MLGVGAGPLNDLQSGRHQAIANIQFTASALLDANSLDGCHQVITATLRQRRS